MLPEFTAPAIEWFALSPLLIMLGAGLVLLVVGALTPPWPKRLYALTTAAAALAAMITTFCVWDNVSD
ncbi:MAG TPA: hypothetical protein PLV68_11345, partial [Ilumatobacteraceae bacterium]|nr:hypothetical protein [Ilumatobacteraceae bacterium]